MVKERIFYVILLVASINLILFVMIFTPHLRQIQSQIEQGVAIPAGVFVPTFNDYYYDFVLVDSHSEGQWQIDTYQEVKRLVDKNGHKIKDIPTGNVEYMRYFIGDDPDSILFDLFGEEEASHDHSN